MFYFIFLRYFQVDKNEKCVNIYFNKKHDYSAIKYHSDTELFLTPLKNVFKHFQIVELPLFLKFHKKKKI